MKPNSIAITLLTLAAAIHPAVARIGEDPKQLEERYGKPEGTKEGADGTTVVAFQHGDLAIQATLWKGKCHQISYHTKAADVGQDAGVPLPPLGETKVKELLAENAPGETWGKKDKLHLAAKAKLEAEAAGVRWRVVMEDGVGKPTTRDYRPDRVNFTVEKGKVTAVKNG